MKGSILILGLLLMSLLLLIGGIFLSLTITYVKQFDIGAQELIAEYIARAGLYRTFHDLQENYSDHEHQVIEVKFGQGKYKVGTISLADRGIHEILIVSRGVIDNPDKTEYYKMAIGGIININIPTDYALFVDGSERIESLYSLPSFFFAGPLHINGNLTLKLIINEYMNSVSGTPKYIIILKPKEIRGPTISLSGRVIYKGISGGVQPSNFNWQYAKVITGEGMLNQSSQFDLDYTGIQWNKPPLIFGEAVSASFFDSASIQIQYKNKYPVNLISGPMPDITGYGITDGEHFGINIKILNWEDITYSHFQSWIDQNWYIKTTDFSNIGSSKIGICNDAIAKKDLLEYGKWNGDPSNITDSNLYTFKYNPEDRIIRHIYYIKPTATTPKYSDGTPVISPERDQDPRTNKNVAMDDLAEGTADDTFSSSNGILTIQNANQWKKHHLHWYVPSNVNYVWNSDLTPNSYWLSEGENRLYLQNGGSIWFRRGPMAQDRELRAVRFATDGPLTFNNPNYYPSSQTTNNDFTLTKYSTNENEIDSNGSAYKIKMSIALNTYYLSGDGTTKRFLLPRNYYWVDKVEFWNGSNWTTQFWNGSSWENRIEAPRYSGRNYYTFATSFDKVVDSNPLNNTSNFGSYGFYRYWNQTAQTVNGVFYDTNTFYIEFGYPPPAGTNNIRIRLGKWWIPLAGEDFQEDGRLEIQQYPPDVNTMILIDPYIQCVRIDLNKINLETCPKNSRYPLGFLDYDGDGIKDEDEPYRPGIIYSKVPLMIEGTPSVPLTIVCEDDVYLKSINSDKPDNDPTAFPVAIIGKKVVWIYHGNENTNATRQVVLNKVAIFTRGERLYNIGGKGEYWGGVASDIIVNKTKLIGSLVKMKKYKNGIENTFTDAVKYGESDVPVYIDKQEMLNPYVYIFDDRDYTSIKNAFQIKYPISFRKKVPPYLPVDMKVKYIRSISNVDEYFNRLLLTIKNQEDVISSTFQALLNEIE